MAILGALVLALAGVGVWQLGGGNADNRSPLSSFSDSMSAGDSTTLTTVATGDQIVYARNDGIGDSTTSTTVATRQQIVYVRNDREIWMVDPDGSHPAKIATCQGRVNGIYASTARSNMAFCTSDLGAGWTLWSLDPTTGKTKALAHNEQSVLSNAFSPDGRALYYCNVDDQRVEVFDFTNQSAVIVSHNPAGNGLALSTDGVLLAYTLGYRGLSAPGGVVVMRTDGSSEVVTEGLDAKPAFFSSDNKYLYLDGGRFRVSVGQDLTLSNRETCGTSVAYPGGCNPNLWFTVSSELTASGQERVTIHVKSLCDSGLKDVRSLLFPKDTFWDPENFCLSPGGYSYAYASTRNGDYDIYNMDELRMTKDIGDETRPAWVSWPISTATTADPQDLTALENLGVTYYQTGQYDKAADAYLEILSVTDDALVRCALGNVYRDQGKYDLAIQAYQQSMVTDPRLKSPYINLAGLYRSLGQLVEALAVLEQGAKNVNGADKETIQSYIQVLTHTTN